MNKDLVVDGVGEGEDSPRVPDGVGATDDGIQAKDFGPVDESQRQ